VPTEAIDYAIPALEIIGFDFLVNRLNYHFGSEKEDYAVTAESIRRNLRSGWSSDRDPFNINQLGHPYQGSMYHGFARSAGFNYWESAGYTFAGSACGRSPARRRTRRSTTRSRAASAAPSSARRSFACRASSSSTAAACRGLARAGGGGGLAGDRLQPPRLQRPLRRRLLEQGRGLLQPLGIGYTHSVREEVGVTSTKFQPNEAQVDFTIDYGLPG
jgi:hypothetical protein